MGRNGKNVLLMTVVLMCFFIIIDTLPLGEDVFSQKASAVPREFEENITVPSDQIVPLDLLFTQGEELELIFDMVVKEDLPVDIWFVDYANYVRLVDGNQFLYFIDGSGQELNKASKVVTVTLHGTYELVFANYNNVTIEVNLKYDINIYPEEEEVTPDDTDKEDETPLWQEFYVMLPLGLFIGLVIGFLVASAVRKPKKGKAKPEKDKPKKKPKKKRVKKKPPKETKSAEAEDKPETDEKATSPAFCGHCGKPVETPFCPFCGKEVTKG